MNSIKTVLRGSLGLVFAVAALGACSSDSSDGKNDGEGDAGNEDDGSAKGGGDGEGGKASGGKGGGAATGGKGGGTATGGKGGGANGGGGGKGGSGNGGGDSDAGSGGNDAGDSGNGGNDGGGDTDAAAGGAGPVADAGPQASIRFCNNLQFGSPGNFQDTSFILVINPGPDEIRFTADTGECAPADGQACTMIPAGDIDYAIYDADLPDTAIEEDTLPNVPDGSQIIADMTLNVEDPDNVFPTGDFYDPDSGSNPESCDDTSYDDVYPPLLQADLTQSMSSKVSGWQSVAKPSIGLHRALNRSLVRPFVR